MQRVGDHNLNRFGVNAHSSHRFGLSAQTAPALTRRLPFSPGCVLRLCLLDSKAVIFASHKLRSRFAWRTIAISTLPLFPYALTLKISTAILTLPSGWRFQMTTYLPCARAVPPCG